MFIYTDVPFVIIIHQTLLESHVVRRLLSKRKFYIYPEVIYGARSIWLFSYANVLKIVKMICEHRNSMMKSKIFQEEETVTICNLIRKTQLKE